MNIDVNVVAVIGAGCSLSGAGAIYMVAVTVWVQLAVHNGSGFTMPNCNTIA